MLLNASVVIESCHVIFLQRFVKEMMTFLSRGKKLDAYVYTIIRLVRIFLFLGRGGGGVKGQPARPPIVLSEV